MKKAILIIIFLVLIATVTAMDECKSTVYPSGVPCLVLLPVNTSATACNTLTTDFYDNTSTLIYAETMGQYTTFLCNATFNQTGYGTYTFYYSTGDSGSVIVEEDVDNTYYLYVVALIVFFILLGLGYYLEDFTPIIIAGFLSVAIAVNLFVNGFPNLANQFLKNGIVIVLAGIGFYFIVVPSIKLIEESK